MQVSALLMHAIAFTVRAKPETGLQLYSHVCLCMNDTHQTCEHFRGSIDELATAIACSSSSLTHALLLLAALCVWQGQ